MAATSGPMPDGSFSAEPGTASTRAGASEATDSRCGLRWRPAGRVRVVRRGSASGCWPRWGSASGCWPRWGRASVGCWPRWGRASGCWPRWGRASPARAAGRAGGGRRAAGRAGGGRRAAGRAGGGRRLGRLGGAGCWPRWGRAWAAGRAGGGRRSAPVVTRSAWAADRTPIRCCAPEAGRARRKVRRAEAAELGAGAEVPCAEAATRRAQVPSAGFAPSRCRIVMGLPAS